MKTKFIILLLAIYFATPIAFTQTSYTVIHINGIEFSKPYSKSQIIEKLGTPTQYIKDEDVSNGVTEIFKYGTTEFAFNRGVLTNASIKDSRFKLYNTVYVGMNLTNASRLLSPLGLIKTEVDDWGILCLKFFNKFPDGISFGGSNYYEFPIYIYYDTAGIITEILYMDLD